MGKVDYNTARDAYHRVLGRGFTAQNINLILNILAGQHTKSGTNFIDQVYMLEAMKIDTTGAEATFTGRHPANTTKYITSGASGQVFRGASGVIYKKIEIEIKIKTNIKELVREAFLEAWMQTVMSEDTTHGKYIGKISRFYRDKNLTTNFEWTVGNTATFYITMENIPNSFEKLLERNGTIKGVQPKLKTLANLLVYLDKEYGFRHRDLHAGNVMFTEGWNLKLIDFGRCCMNYYYSPDRLGWYSMPAYGGRIPKKLESAVTANGSSNNAYCFSLDILILIIYLLQDSQYMALMDTSLQQMFYRAVISNGGINLYKYCEREAAKHKQPPFAHVYPWSFQHWNKEDIDILLDTPTVFLHGFQKFITGVKEEDYGEDREEYVPPVTYRQPTNNSSWFCRIRGVNGDCLKWARRLLGLGGGKTLKKRSRRRITRKH